MVLPVVKIIKFSNVDGPGNRMAIFLQGCNYDCDYCHNPETIGRCTSCKACISSCPVEALERIGKQVIWNEEKCIKCDRCIKKCVKNASPMITKYNIEDLLIEIKKVAPFLEGITISGGESTLYYKEITELFKKIKEETNLTCFIDTNGSLPLKEERYKEFVEVTDSFMLDVKAWDKKIHKKLTKMGNKNVIENLSFLFESEKLFEVRTVVLETLDSEKTIEEVSKVIKNSQTRYKIIKYRKIGVREGRLVGIPEPTQEELKRLESLSKEIGVREVLVV